MRPRSVLSTALIAFLLSGIGVATVLGQDVTPAGGGPGECQVEPRSAASFEQLAATRDVETREADAAASPSPFAKPEGDPADEGVVTAVTATSAGLVACLNAGDYLRAYALYTDDYLRRNFSPEEIAAIAATPEAAAAETEVAFLGVRDVVVLDDGRVGGLVDTANPDDDGDVTTYTVFVKEGDAYLIDEETVVEAPEADAAAPAAEADAEGAGVEVLSLDIYFEPDEFSIPADTDVVISLPNEGAALHNFAIDELGIDVDIAAGATEEVTINAPAGDYEYYCNVPGHKQAGMAGEMEVG